MDPVRAEEAYVSKLQIITQNKHVFIKLLWKPNEDELFHLQVVDGDCSWSGKFSNETAKSFRVQENIDETEKQYSTNVKKSLTAEDDSYTYDLVTDRDTASFTWKKRFKGNTGEGKGIKVIHGKVPLHKDDTPVNKDTLIDILISKNKDLKNHVEEQTRHRENLLSELEKCKNELEKFVDIKTSLESTLYGKFLKVLNAKKRRIQLLEDNLLNFEEPDCVNYACELD